MEQKIVEYLKEKYSPEVLILIGSRARGMQRDNSDWDIIGFSYEKLKSSILLIDQHYIDLGFYTLPVTDKFYLRSNWSPICHARILLDNQQGLGQAIIDRSAQAYATGPEQIADGQRHEKLYNMYKILGRIEGYQNSSEIQFYHLGRFYELAIRYWYELQRQWPLPVYEAVPQILAREPHFHQLLLDISQGAAGSAKKTLECRKIIEYLASLRENKLDERTSSLCAEFAH